MTRIMMARPRGLGVCIYIQVQSVAGNIGVCARLALRASWLIGKVHAAIRA